MLVSGSRPLRLSHSTAYRRSTSRGWPVALSMKWPGTKELAAMVVTTGSRALMPPSVGAYALPHVHIPDILGTCSYSPVPSCRRRLPVHVLGDGPADQARQRAILKLGPVLGRLGQVDGDADVDGVVVVDPPADSYHSATIAIPTLRRQGDGMLSRWPSMASARTAIAS